MCEATQETQEAAQVDAVGQIWAAADKNVLSVVEKKSARRDLAALCEESSCSLLCQIDGAGKTKKKQITNNNNKY